MLRFGIWQYHLLTGFNSLFSKQQLHVSFITYLEAALSPKANPLVQENALFFLHLLAHQACVANCVNPRLQRRARRTAVCCDWGQGSLVLHDQIPHVVMATLPQPSAVRHVPVKEEMLKSSLWRNNRDLSLIFQCYTSPATSPASPIDISELLANAYANYSQITAENIEKMRFKQRMEVLSVLLT